MMWSYAVLLSVMIIFLAYTYQKYQLFQIANSSTDHSRGVMEAWQRIIKEPETKITKVVIGINACVDLIVDGVSVLEALHLHPGKQTDHVVLTSLQDLQEAFHHHFNSGAAAERYFSNGDVFEMVVQHAADVDDVEFSIGGNAALIAQKMALDFPDVKIQLVGPVGPRLQDLLHGSVSVPRDSLTVSDEIHLILEYRVGDRWGNTVTSVATRFITSHDELNSEARSLAQFFQAVVDYQPDLVVLSGLHMLDGQPSDVWSERTKVAREGLEAIDPCTPVHLELASMANSELMKVIMSEIIPKVTSLGLNEQELAFLSHVVGGPHSEIFDAEGQPEVYKVTDTLSWILRVYGEGSLPQSRLSRVHFHSLTFHVLAVHKSRWRDVMSAVVAGSRTASLQACNVNTLNEDLSELRTPLTFKLYSGGSEVIFDVNNPAISFSHEGFEFVFSPVLVCRRPLKTVGLGDAISATGLIYSTYTKCSL